MRFLVYHTDGAFCKTGAIKKCRPLTVRVVNDGLPTRIRVGKARPWLAMWVKETWEWRSHDLADRTLVALKAAYINKTVMRRFN